MRTRALATGPRSQSSNGSSTGGLGRPRMLGTPLGARVWRGRRRTTGKWGSQPGGGGLPPAPLPASGLCPLHPSPAAPQNAPAAVGAGGGRARRGRRVGLAPGPQGPGPSRPAAARSACVQPADVREAPRPRAPSSLGAARSVPTEGSRYFQMFEAAWGTSFPDAQTLNWAGAGEGASPPPASGGSEPGSRPSVVVRAQMGSGAPCLGPWHPPRAISGAPHPECPKTPSSH